MITCSSRIPICSFGKHETFDLGSNRSVLPPATDTKFSGNKDEVCSQYWSEIVLLPLSLLLLLLSPLSPASCKCLLLSIVVAIDIISLQSFYRVVKTFCFRRLMGPPYYCCGYRICSVLGWEDYSGFSEEVSTTLENVSSLVAF